MLKQYGAVLGKFRGCFQLSCRHFSVIIVYYLGTHLKLRPDHIGVCIDGVQRGWSKITQQGRAGSGPAPAGQRQGSIYCIIWVTCQAKPFSPILFPTCGTCQKASPLVGSLCSGQQYPEYQSLLRAITFLQRSCSLNLTFELCLYEMCTSA